MSALRPLSSSVATRWSLRFGSARSQTGPPAPPCHRATRSPRPAGHDPRLPRSRSSRSSVFHVGYADFVGEGAPFSAATTSAWPPRCRPRTSLSCRPRLSSFTCRGLSRSSRSTTASRSRSSSTMQRALADPRVVIASEGRQLWARGLYSRSACGSHSPIRSMRCLSLGWSLANSGGSFPLDARSIRFQNASASRGLYPARAM
jgi:hypothetical protein